MDQTKVKELLNNLDKAEEIIKEFLQDTEDRLSSVYYRNYDKALNKHYVKYLSFNQEMELVKKRIEEALKSLHAWTKVFSDSQTKKLTARFEKEIDEIKNKIEIINCIIKDKKNGY